MVYMVLRDESPSVMLQLEWTQCEQMLIAIVMDSLPADHKKICIFHLDSHKWWCVSCKGWLFCVRQLLGFDFLQDPHLLSL